MLGSAAVLKEAQLVEELNVLLKQQSAALNDSIFLGMSEQQEREYAYRQAKIHELQKQLGRTNILDSAA